MPQGQHGGNKIIHQVEPTLQRLTVRVLGFPSTYKDRQSSAARAHHRSPEKKIGVAMLTNQEPYQQSTRATERFLGEIKVVKKINHEPKFTQPHHPITLERENQQEET